MHASERRHVGRENNRRVRSFEWGAEHIIDHGNGDDSRRLVARYAREAVERSDEFYALPPITDYQLHADNLLTWTSAVRTPTTENNTARARFFPEVRKINQAARPRRAVVLLPQWNAGPESHMELARILARLGIAALRLTLPYHEARNEPGLQRADYLTSPNVGRTLQSMRQGVLDARAAINWLSQQGYESIGIMGTSIGSCLALLTFAHEPLLKAGVFNHVSGYVADVVWRGITTQHVRAGFGDALTLEELRAAWLPISPFAYTEKLRAFGPRPMRFIAARYDLTFPIDLSQDLIDGVRRAGHPLDVVWLPCGHYTLGQAPWKHIDGWKIVTYLRRHLK